MTPNVQAIVDRFVEDLRAEIVNDLTAALVQGTTPTRPLTAALVQGTRMANGASRPKGQKRPPEELQKLTNDLYATIIADPGKRIEEIAKAMGVSTKDLTLPAKKLLADKAVSVEGQKRATRYFPFAAKGAAKPKRAPKRSSKKRPAKKTKRSRR
jgi:hypothetical protein